MAFNVMELSCRIHASFAFVPLSAARDCAYHTPHNAGSDPTSAGQENAIVAYREDITMQRAVACGFALVAGLSVAIFANAPAAAQDGPGWTVLLDSTKMGDWDRVGETRVWTHSLSQ
jgi:hypothetical protein